MSSTHRHDNMVPPAAIGLACLLVVVTLLLVAFTRAGVLPASPSAAQLRSEARIRPVAERLLFFADDKGFVRVTDARSGDTIAMLGQEGSGFIRGVMRGLARERRMHKLDASRPFRLTLYADTQLALTDLATGRVVELSGFGGTNRAAFARLLENRP
jgi:putative photosynthetic complex assembly protein